MVHMAFGDMSYTFHKQVTNASQYVFVILLWGILTSPLMPCLLFFLKHTVTFELPRTHPSLHDPSSMHHDPFPLISICEQIELIRTTRDKNENSESNRSDFFGLGVFCQVWHILCFIDLRGGGRTPPRCGSLDSCHRTPHLQILREIEAKGEAGNLYRLDKG